MSSNITDALGRSPLLRAVFEPDFNDPDHRVDGLFALIGLAEIFVTKYHQQKASNLLVDQTAVGQLLLRFWKDAFGYAVFYKQIEKLIDPAKKPDLKIMLEHLPVHINSLSPRKTRIAAAYTYASSIYRPFRYAGDSGIDMTIDKFGNFNTHFTTHVALFFLGDWGIYSWGSDAQDRKVRQDHFMTAIGDRDLSLVALEMLFGAIFRPYRAPGGKITD